MNIRRHKKCDLSDVIHESLLGSCIKCRIASTRKEREGAFQLLYSAYRRAGLMKANTCRMKITPYHLAPTTNVIVARYLNQTISTLSFVEDGQLGMPSESIFTREVREYRRQGLRLAEVSCLADRRKDIKRCFPVFMSLYRLMIQFALNQGIDHLLIAVHPRHVRLYTRYLTFDKIASERPYPLAQNHPAVMLSLDLKRLRVEQPAAYERFLGNAIEPSELQPHPMCHSERDHFMPFLEDQLAIMLPSPLVGISTQQYCETCLGLVTS